MARSLVVWGLNSMDWSQEQDSMIEHGCNDDIELHDEGDAAWCTVSFPSLTAAEGCACYFQQHFKHLRVYVEPDWHVFGSSKAGATVDLIWLSEWLGCRDTAHMLPQPRTACLTRGVSAILAALARAGGAAAPAATDPAAATCLYHGLSQLPPDSMLSRVYVAFARLAPGILRAAAAEAHGNAPIFPQRIVTAAQLADVFLGVEKLRGRVMDSKLWLDMASDCMSLLRAVADALSEWLAAVGRAVQQHSLANSTEQPAQLPDLASELQTVANVSSWLPLAACSLLQCMQQTGLALATEAQQLLNTLGQLCRKVVACVELEERAAAAGLWPVSTHLSAAACVGQLHYAIGNVVMRLGEPGHAGLPALHSAIFRALGVALDSITAPRHLALLLYLPLSAQLTLPPCDHPKPDLSKLLMHLVRVQQQAVSWLSLAPQDVPLPDLSEDLPGLEGMPLFEDQLAYLIDLKTWQLAAAVNSVLVTPNKQCHTTVPDGTYLKALEALATALQVAPCRNVRGLCSGLAPRDDSSCLAPGLFRAAIALDKAAKPAFAAADQGKPWAGDAITALVQGGLGSFRLAHAESKAQEALPSPAPQATSHDTCVPQKTRGWGAVILVSALRGTTPHVSHTLATRGLVPLLLQAMPWSATSLECGADITSWYITLTGTRAIGGILGAIFAADAPARMSVLRDGSWDAAAQRIRELQPPASLAAEWYEQQEVLLHRVTAALEGSGSIAKNRTGVSTAAPDSEAVAAADRAMQELLAEEEPDAPAGQRSKAASKRARKKAAKQHAAASSNQQAATPLAQVADVAVEAATVTSEAVTGQPAVMNSGSSTSIPEAASQQPEAVQVAQAAAERPGDGAGAALVPLQQSPAAAGSMAGEPEWWRCPLSGVVMRDPVLYGSGGHSFQRAALEEWLAANPGVDPLSRQPLPAGDSSFLPNYALRNMIQQLQLG